MMPRWETNGVFFCLNGESVHRGADWTDVYGRGDHR